MGEGGEVLGGGGGGAEVAGELEGLAGGEEVGAEVGGRDEEVAGEAFVEGGGVRLEEGG